MFEGSGWIVGAALLAGFGFLFYPHRSGLSSRLLHYLIGIYCLWAAVFLLLNPATFHSWNRGIATGLVLLSAAYLAAGILVDFKSWLQLKFQSFGRPSLAPYLTEIATALDYLAKRKVGALIVIERKLPLAQFTTKGIPFDAEVKAEILISLFTPPSLVHDGAALIKKGRMESVKVVLPLATNQPVAMGVGTRHRAAVSITERTDALALVVSEERGEMSMVYKGEIRKASSVEELQGFIRTVMH